jgi:molybdate transport repressor ModE-like protein
MPKPEAVTFKQLRALGAVAACGSITQAAEALGLTPPAVHTQLRLLEEKFASKLLHRSASGGAQLTRQGQTVLSASQVIEATLASCAGHVRALNSGMEGLVVLGIVSTGKYFAPALVARLQAVYPKIEVQMKVGNRDSVVAWLQNGSIDMAIMGRPPRSPAVSSLPLGPHPHVLIAPPDHPLAGPGMVPPDALMNETFLAREEGSGTRILMVRYLDRVGQGTTYKIVEIGTNETIKQAVIAGLGIALISRHTVTEELRAGRLVELNIEGLPIVRQWFLLHRSDVELSAASQRVQRFIADQNGAFLPV